MMSGRSCFRSTLDWHWQNFTEMHTGAMQCIAAHHEVHVRVLQANKKQRVVSNWPRNLICPDLMWQNVIQSPSGFNCNVSLLSKLLSMICFPDGCEIYHIDV